MDFDDSRTNTISSLLSKSPKKNMLQQAFLFAVTKESIKSFQEEFFPNLKIEFDNSLTFVAHSKGSTIISIRSKEPGFVAFLKTEALNLQEYLTFTIGKRCPLGENNLIELKITN